MANKHCVQWDTQTCDKEVRNCLKLRGDTNANVTGCIHEAGCSFETIEKVDTFEERTCYRSLANCWPRLKDNENLLQRCMMGDNVYLLPSDADAVFNDKI